MIINATSTAPDTFKLSGHDMQETFSDEKYTSLASANPQGIALRHLVEEHWTEWLDIVETAPWTRNWSRSPLRKATVPAATPCGKQVSGGYTKYAIASAVYAQAVWGYGMQGWLKGTKASLTPRPGKTKRRTPGQYNDAMWCILDMQRVKAPNAARTWFWDDKIYRGCGILVPCEFGELDRWLEPLWVEACAMVDTARVSGYADSGALMSAT